MSSSDNKKGRQNIGGFAGRNYDECAYQLHLKESVSPLEYRLQKLAFENPSACTFDGVYRTQQSLVDQESELKNITRQSSKCVSKEYNPKCNWVTGNDSCKNTMDSFFPVVYAFDSMCPVVTNNIKKNTNSGFVVKQQNSCK